MTKISVIVPIYNLEGYLEECLNSIINQTLQNIEIILINDGSTDNSIRIMKKYERNDSRIKIINQVNIGQGGSRNVGIKHSSSEYLMFIDGDDTIEANMCEILYNIINTKQSDIATCRYRRIKEDGTFTNQLSKEISSSFNIDYFKDILSLKYPSVTWNAIYKRELFIKNNLYFPNMYYEDIAFIFKLFFFSKSVTFTNEVLYNWRIREGSITRTIDKKQINDIFSIFDITFKFLNENKCYKQYKSEFISRCFKRVNLLIKRTEDFSEDQDISFYFQYISTKIKECTYLNRNNLLVIKKSYFAVYLKYLENIAIMDSYKEQTQKELYKKSISNIKQNLLLDRLFKTNLKYTSSKKILELKDKFKNETCFILGQGPSFNDFNKDLLKNKFTFIFGNHFNSINFNQFTPTFYIENDELILNEYANRINNLKVDYLFLPNRYKKTLKKEERPFYFFNEDFTYFNYFDKNFQKIKFSKSIDKKFYISTSTLFLTLQLAYYLGFKKVYLLGIDLNYETENITINRDTTKEGLKLIIKDFEKAKKIFERDNREIINLSKESILKMFKYQEYPK